MHKLFLQQKKVCLNLFLQQKVCVKSSPFYGDITILASRLSGNFTDHPEISSLSGNFPGYPENIKTIRNLSRPSRKYPDYPATFQALWKFSKLSGNFPDHPENIQIIQKLSRLSGNFLDHPENIQTIWKFCRRSAPSQCIFKGCAQKPSMCKNFPDGNATLPRWFLGLCL